MKVKTSGYPQRHSEISQAVGRCAAATKIPTLSKKSDKVGRPAWPG
jgi:hypothetical protein